MNSNLKSDNGSCSLRCATAFVDNNKHKYASETLQKIGDFQSLMKLYVKLQKWDRAFELAKQHPGHFKEDLYLPYAEYLAFNDRFEEAQEAYRSACCCWLVGRFVPRQ